MKGYNLARVKVHQTLDELVESGLQESKRVSYDQLAVFKTRKRDQDKIMHNVRAMLVPELIPLRNQRMSANPFAFFRGSVELMDHDLVRGNNSGIPAIICGDAHIGNFGFFASPERQLLFDLNDFDESGINYWEWDLKRLLVSVLLAGKMNDFKDSKLTKLLLKVSASYRKGLETAYGLTALERFYPKNTVSQLVNSLDDADKTDFLQKIVNKATNRNSEQVVRKFTITDKYGNFHFKDNAPRTVHLTKVNVKQVSHYLQQYRTTVRPDVSLLLSEYHVTDIVRHSVGVGSFGTLCYLVLLTNIDGTHLVLQIKEALPTRKRRGEDKKALTLALETSEGQRIIDCQKVLQSASDPFLGYFQTDTKSFYVRQFRDMKESVDITKLTYAQFKTYVKTCAVILANAHSQNPTGAAILGYVHDGEQFDAAISNWASAYITQVQSDYEHFIDLLKQTAK